MNFFSVSSMLTSVFPRLRIKLTERIRQMKLSTQLMVLIVCFTCMNGVANAQPPHPWRPPFGLDRVGSAEHPPGIEADAVAHSSVVQNPVDLGTILPPDGWLLLGQGQSANLSVAVISHGKDESQTKLRAWFARQPDQSVEKLCPLIAGKRVEAMLNLKSSERKADRDELHVMLERLDGTVLWQKTIPAMLVQSTPQLPQFGAISTKLRYDLPISIRQEDGSFTELDYSKGWDASLNDVVVCLPNGSRFVFWRGSCYIPFWAGRYNTALSYEWAETKPPADGFKDCVEPLMDKELRYSRVQIVESTVSRVHVRWTYQSCDFNYKVWGDGATEDFYFYPDGYGTRVLTLQSALDSEYELSEFIVLTPPGAYPFQVLPSKIVEVLYPDGEKREIEFPYDAARHSAKLKSRDSTAVYRVKLHRDDDATAIYYHPTDRQLPPVVFGGFVDQGQVVTPSYWGSHWPLGRGQTTGGTIDQRMHLTPSHNSLMSWAMQKPAALRESRLVTLDTLGHSKPMQRQTWAWMIGQSNESDAAILERSTSFARPPSLELSGARLAAEPFVQERRAICLMLEKNDVTLKLIPSEAYVNPVFEIEGVVGKLTEVTVNQSRLPVENWSWDGKALWINQTIREPSTIQLHFQQ